MGGQFGGEWIHVYIWLSSWNYHDIVNQLNFNLKWTVWKKKIWQLKATPRMTLAALKVLAWGNSRMYCLFWLLAPETEPWPPFLRAFTGKGLPLWTFPLSLWDTHVSPTTHKCLPQGPGSHSLQCDHQEEQGLCPPVFVGGQNSKSDITVS